MLDNEFIKWLAGLGVGGVLAGMLFMFYRKDVKQFTDLWKMQSDREAARTEMLIGVVRENTSSNTQLVEMIRSLHHRLDADPLPPRQVGK